MWVYQFGYRDELRGFGDRPVWINPLWFWEYHPKGKRHHSSTLTHPKGPLPRHLALFTTAVGKKSPHADPLIKETRFK